MALTYSPLIVNGKFAEGIFSELFFENKTIAEGLVSFEADIKSQTVFTENTNTVVVQPYIAGQPSSSGSTTLADTIVTPVKLMTYMEFNPETLRPSKFNKALASGAWNIENNEFARTVLATYSKQISAEMENQFWNGALAATQSTVAGLASGSTVGTPSAQEKVLEAALPVALFDGVVSKLISGLKRGKVVGTTITSSNIATEYGKLYAAIPAIVLDAFEAPVIYAPRSHKQLINIYNTNATYRDLFDTTGGKFFYNGIEIKFVPVKENVLIATLPSHVAWCTDLVSDFNYIQIDKIATNRDDMFVKSVFTLESYIANQGYSTLYVG